MELAWICEESGRQFQRVPQQLAEEAGAWGWDLMEGGGGLRGLLCACTSVSLLLRVPQQLAVETCNLVVCAPAVPCVCLGSVDRQAARQASAPNSLHSLLPLSTAWLCVVLQRPRPRQHWKQRTWTTEAHPSGLADGRTGRQPLRPAQGGTAPAFTSSLPPVTLLETAPCNTL